LRLNIKQLKASEGRPYAFEQLERWGHLAYKGQSLDYTRPVHMKGQAFYRSGIVSVRVFLTTEIEAECSRCLKPIHLPVQLAEELEMQEEPEAGFQGVLLEEFSFEHGVDELELMPYFEQLIVTSLESKPLCRSDCRGLCPTCGKDLNEGVCACGEQRAVDPRLEKLKDLLA